MTRTRAFTGLALLGLLSAARPVAAQDTLRVVVQYIAGANVYLGAGSDAGVRTGDTLLVRRVPSGEGAGPLVVVTSTPGRSVVAFLGAPYSLTRGDTLAITFRHATVAVAPAVAVPVPLGEAGVRPAARRVVSVDGSLSFDLDVMQTKTTGVGSDPEQLTRNFTTPSLGLRYRAQGLPNGWEFRTGLRATQRSSTGSVVTPATLVQVYELAMARRGAHGDVVVGRFYNPYEFFSGYWDGMMLHRGTERSGIGLLAGFAPDRGNSGFQTSEPKVGAFAHLRTRGTRVRYRTEFSANLLFPRDTAGTHVITGWGQALQAGDLVLSHTMQVERSALGGTWGVTRLQTRISTRIGQGGTLYTGYTLNQLNLGDTTTGVLPYRRDQMNAGFNVWSGTTGLSLDVSTSRQHGLPSQWAYSAMASRRSRSASAFGASLSAMYWNGGYSDGMLLSPTLLRRFGAVDAQFDYQFYRSKSGVTTSTSHAFELGARLPLSAHTQFAARLRQRTGGYLKSSGVYVGLWYGF